MLKIFTLCGDVRSSFLSIASGSLQSGTVEKSPSEILKQHQSFLPLLGRGIVRGGDYVDLFSPPPSLAKVGGIRWGSVLGMGVLTVV